MSHIRRALFWLLGAWTLLFTNVGVFMILDPASIDVPRVGKMLIITVLAWAALVYWHFAARDYAKAREEEIEHSSFKGQRTEVIEKASKM